MTSRRRTMRWAVRRVPHLAASFLVAVGACSSKRSPSGDLADLQRLLDDDRRGHLELDAGLIASHLADTLLSVDAGRITRMPRAAVEESFRASFAGTHYFAWDDVHEPMIHLLPGERTAWVVRTVHADREQPGLGGRPVHRAFTCAWTATYEKRDGAWLMTSVTSTFAPSPTEADLIVAAARRHWGAAAANLASLRAEARAQGPRGSFGVRVCSARDGRAWIEFEDGLTAGITSHAAWMRAAPDSAARALPRDIETFLRGHEVHMNLLDPASRYASLHFTGTASFAGRRALRLTGFDAAGSTADFFYAQTDSAPLGYRVADHVRHREPPTLTVDDWETARGLCAFRRAIFRQGAEEFTYRYIAIQMDPAAADSLLADPR